MDSLSKRRILIVDDEDDLRETILAHAELMGFDAMTAANGIEALELMNTERFDAIISDVQMPKMNGLEFLKQLRLLQDNTPFIVLTGMAEKQTAVAALRLGALDFIDKPFQGDELRAVITRAVEIGVRRTRLQAFQAEGADEAAVREQKMIDLLQVANSVKRSAG